METYSDSLKVSRIIRLRAEHGAAWINFRKKANYFDQKNLIHSKLCDKSVYFIKRYILLKVGLL